MNDSKTGTRKTSGVEVLAIFASVPIAIALHGWAISILWGWFVVPLGIGPIGTLHAIGITIFADLLTRKQAAQESKMSPWVAVGGEFLAPLLALGFGWCIHAFM